MAATVSGSKVVTQTVSPALTHTLLTNLMGVAPENFTIAQWNQILDATKRISGGGNPNATIGSLLR